MKRIFVFFICVVFFSSFCFAVPHQPTDKSSFSETVPEGSTPPGPFEQLFITSNIKKPLPTNKFFNSIIINPSYHNKYSLNMYTYPQVFRAQNTGLLIEYPKMVYSQNKINFKDNEYDYGADNYANAMVVSVSTTTSNGYTINFASTALDKYSDFSATMKWEKNNYWITSTIVQGSPFSYYEFSDGVYPSIDFPYEWGNYWNDGEKAYTLYDVKTGEEIENSTLEYVSDSMLLHIHLAEKDLYYGIFVPKETKFVQDSDNIEGGVHYFPWVRTVIDFSGTEKYMSVALLPSTSLKQAKEDVKTYYKYAYNFITDTKVSWDVSSSDYSSKTTFNITTVKKRTDIEEQQDDTLFCLYPHQYNNLYSSVDFIGNKSFNTLRGVLKLAKGSGFSTKVNFNGIVPFFEYDLTDIKEDLTNYLKSEVSEIDVHSVSGNPYRAGKIIAKLANMLPIADNLKNDTIKKSIVIKLKALLSDWLSYSGNETSKYFAYDKTWGGLLGIKDSEFHSFDYNDHHFHFGYFIYAAAILTMYDTDFADNYGQMINLLIKDIANTTRNDSDFPFMRHFDFYESHSWANGMGGQDNGGIDQESSSEAMNAWSAIYLWGLATDNEEYKKLGAYLYSSEYEAIKYYYFDIDGEILTSGYKHNSVGRFFGGLVSYDLFFEPMIPQTIKGIQVLPMTPAMTYLAYNKTYLDNFYTSSLSESGSNPKQWYDIWARLVSLYNPSTALSNFDKYKNESAEEGSSKSFTYHFINFFNNYGTPIFDYSADVPSYMVLDNGTSKTFCVYNYTDSNKTVRFYDSSKKYVGSINVSAKSFALTSNLVQAEDINKFSIYPVPYKPNSGGKYDGEGITFLNISPNSNIKIFNISGEKVFETVTDLSSTYYLWDTKNNSGNNVASGIYIYMINADGKTKKGKLAIER